jgi:hypothetical protein
MAWTTLSWAGFGGFLRYSGFGLRGVFDFDTQDQLIRSALRIKAEDPMRFLKFPLGERFGPGIVILGFFRQVFASSF